MDTILNNSNDYIDINEFNVSSETWSRRSMCSNCMRPTAECWCPFLPKEPIKTKSNIIILQHSKEQCRRIRTAPMLERGLEEGKCEIVRGIKFDECAILEKASKDNIVLMYPAPDAEDLTEYVSKSHQEPCSLLLLDGTWIKAEQIYKRNKWLWQIKKVKVTPTEKSRFIIRRQPNDHCLSTVESGALALSILEQRPEIMQMLIQPLIGMCDLQMQHGAGTHTLDLIDCSQVKQNKKNKKWYDLPPKQKHISKGDDDKTVMKKENMWYKRPRNKTAQITKQTPSLALV